jgi:hypothetical protein
MIEQVLARKAIHKALESKIEALGGSEKIKDGSILELEFWNDLADKFQGVFIHATAEDVSLAIAGTEEIDERFTLESITPRISYAPDEGLGLTVYEAGSLLTNRRDIFITWKVMFARNALSLKTASKKKHVFALTIGALIYKPTNEIAIEFNAERGVAYRLLKYFAEHPGRSKTVNITADKDVHTNAANLAGEVGKMRTEIFNRIGLDGMEFIASEPGYGLGDNIKIEVL